MKRSKPSPRTPSSALYRVALHGFSDFERTALSFSLKHAATREPAYLQVERLADADFIVADASHEALASSVTRGVRMRDTLFVGEHVPVGAQSQVERPIDTRQILRGLDEMAARRATPAPATGRPDIVLPMPASETDFPMLSEFDIIETTPASLPDIVETTPAAFHHEPVLINLADLEPIARRGTRSSPPPAPPEGAPAPRKVPGRLPGLKSNAPAATAAATSSPPVEPSAHPPSPIDDRNVKPALGPAIAGLVVPAGADKPAPDPPPAVSHAPAAAKRAMTSDERVEAKAEARRRSRRARLAQAGRAGAESLRDVLLLGPERAHADLAAQLEAFGFHVRHATYSADALGLIAEMPLAAIFLDVAPGNDDMDGLELCMEIKHRRVMLAGAVPPVFLLANRDSAAGRVRAKLAGCDALLVRPVTRGDAARALEACDVALPADERHIQRP